MTAARAADARPRGWSRWPLVLLLLYPVVSDNLYYQNMIILSLVFAIGAVGLNMISGYGGYMSLGQGAFLGLGAYTLAILSHPRRRLGLGLGAGRRASWPALFAALLGVIALRTRGPSFVIMTIAFLFLLQIVAHQLDVAHERHRGHHAAAADVEHRHTRTGRSTTRWPALLAAVAADDAGGSGGPSSAWAWSRCARTRTRPRRSASTRRSTSCSAFVASAVFVGMAGAVYGYYLAFVDPIGMFNILLSVQILLSMLLGGRGTLCGPVLGAFLIEPLNEYANNNARRRQRAAAGVRRR